MIIIALASVAVGVAISSSIGHLSGHTLLTNWFNLAGPISINTIVGLFCNALAIILLTFFVVKNYK